jgi:hypothetical protein
MAWASKQVAGGGTNKLVLLMIADATSHDSPMLVIKMERMMMLCELKERTIRDALRDLETRGLIGTVLRFFEGQQIANGYFLMGEEWVEAARDRIDSENHKDGFSCRIRSGIFEGRPAPDAALGGHQMPGGGAPDAGQLLPSSLLPSSDVTELSYARAEATEQQPEKASGEAATAHLSDAADALRSELTVEPAQRKQTKAKNKSSSIPSLEEFVAWASVSHAGWEREAEAWHKRMASQDWITSSGKPVLNAKGTFNTWKVNGWIQKLPEAKARKPASLGY